MNCIITAWWELVELRSQEVWRIRHDRSHHPKQWAPGSCFFTQRLFFLQECHNSKNSTVIPWRRRGAETWNLSLLRFVARLPQWVEWMFWHSEDAAAVWSQRSVSSLRFWPHFSSLSSNKHWNILNLYLLTLHLLFMPLSWTETFRGIFLTVRGRGCTSWI